MLRNGWLVIRSNTPIDDPVFHVGPDSSAPKSSSSSLAACVARQFALSRHALAYAELHSRWLFVSLVAKSATVVAAAVVDGDERVDADSDDDALTWSVVAARDITGNLPPFVEQQGWFSYYGTQSDPSRVRVAIDVTTAPIVVLPLDSFATAVDVDARTPLALALALGNASLVRRLLPLANSQTAFGVLRCVGDDFEAALAAFELMLAHAVPVNSYEVSLDSLVGWFCFFPERQTPLGVERRKHFTTRRADEHVAQSKLQYPRSAPRAE